jgi:hypothetical protein
MKKSIAVVAAVICSLIGTAQESNGFRLGIQSGMQANRSKYAGGMDNANARFHQNPFGAHGWNVAARYDFNRRWAILSGIGITTVGFEFGIAENYSFSQRSSRFTMLNSGFHAVEIPIMGAYKFKPNCNGWKWILSAGVANLFTPSQNRTNILDGSTEGTPSPEKAYLSSVESTNPGSHLQARFMIGREKVFGSGSILNVNLVFNRGFSEIARSTVSYNIDGQNYSHQFSNKGNFVGLRIAYYFRPFSSFSKKPSVKNEKKS